MNELEGLRDIHLPATGGWWPLAPGWWLLLAVLAFAALLLFQRKRRRRRISQAALNEALQELQGLASEQSPRTIIRELSVLLRRVALTVHGRRRVAGLTGDDWLAFLDAQGKTTEFSNGMGQVFAELPYRKQVTLDTPGLLKLVEQWIQQQGKWHV